MSNQQITNQTSTSGQGLSLRAAPSVDHLMRVSRNDLMVDEKGNRFIAKPLEGDARTILQRRLNEVERLLMPWAGTQDKNRVTGALARMLQGFGAAASDTMGTVAAYCLALNDLPLWAIEQACDRIARGMMPDINPDFRPSAARVHQSVGEILMVLQEERGHLISILNAKPKEEVQASAGEQDRIVAGFAKLQADLQGRSAGNTGVDKRRRAEHIQRQIERNDIEILEEWRAAGLDPIMNQGRPVSLDLAKQLGIVRVEQREAV